MAHDNYYDDIMLQIEALMQSEQYEEALKLIGIELNAPYVPSDTEQKLQALLRDAMMHVRGSKKPTMSVMPDNFPDFLFHEQSEERFFAISSLAQLNAMPFVDDLATFFASAKYPATEKVFLLLTLKSQKLDHEFLYSTSEGDKTINPAHFDLSPYVNRFNEIYFIFEKLGDGKNVTTANTFRNVAMTMINDTMLFDFQFDAWEMALGLIYTTYKMLNEEFDYEAQAKAHKIPLANVKAVIKKVEQLLAA